MVPPCNPPLVSQNAEFTPELSHFRASAALWSSGSSAAVTDLFEIGAKGIGSLHFSWTGFKLPRCSRFPVLSRLTHLPSQGKVHSQHTQNTKTRITMGLEQSPRKKGWFFFYFFIPSTNWGQSPSVTLADQNNTILRYRDPLLSSTEKDAVSYLSKAQNPVKSPQFISGGIFSFISVDSVTEPVKAPWRSLPPT